MNNLDSLQQEEERLGLAPKAINGNAVAIGEESGYTNGVPNSLVKAVIQKESGGNPKAVSKSGAIGMMQLMPDTAKELGVDPWDANQNIQGGTKYLKQQFDKYQDWEKALAAYNAGSGTVDKAIALGGDWKANMAKIQNPSNYQQTKDYVDTLAKHANTPIEILRQEESRLFGTYNPTQYDQVGIPNETKGTSPQNVDWVEQGALNTKWQNMWNAFKQGMDQTKLSASFAQQDDAQEILDNYPDKKIELDAQLKTGEIDNTEYQNQLLDLQILAQEAQKNIQNSQEEIDSRNTKIKNEPVSQKYQVQNF